jgi:hypothetical protein
MISLAALLTHCVGGSLVVLPPASSTDILNASSPASHNDIDCLSRDIHT